MIQKKIHFVYINNKKYLKPMFNLDGLNVYDIPEMMQCSDAVVYNPEITKFYKQLNYFYNIEKAKKLHPDYEVNIWVDDLGSVSDQIKTMLSDAGIELKCSIELINALDIDPAIKNAVINFDWSYSPCDIIDFTKYAAIYLHGGVVTDLNFIFMDRIDDRLMNSKYEIIHSGFENFFVAAEQNNQSILKLLNSADITKFSDATSTSSTYFFKYYTEVTSNSLALNILHYYTYVKCLSNAGKLVQELIPYDFDAPYFIGRDPGGSPSDGSQSWQQNFKEYTVKLSGEIEE